MPTEMVRPLDAGWIWLETDSNLMHGSVLALFTPPPGAGDDFVDALTDRMRSHRVPSAPFDRRLKPGLLSRLVPQWDLVSEIDPDYHLRRVTLSAPGGQRELAQVVSSLHGTALDHSRPPWMVHVIDGLEDGRFAVLGQMHHALADGVTALRIVDWWLSDDPTAQDVPPIWAFKRPRRRSRRPGRTNPLRSAIAAVGTGARGVTGGLHAVRRTLTGLSARPWSAPGSAINGAITARRRVATQSFEMERFRTLSESTGGTINDVVLAVCAGGLRAYLEEIGELPERPLVTNMPVSVRRGDSDADVGNAISWAMLALATDIDDVRERFEAIRAATVQAKQRLRAMPPSAVDAYTLLAVSPILAEQLLRMGGRVPRCSTSRSPMCRGHGTGCSSTGRPSTSCTR